MGQVSVSFLRTCVAYHEEGSEDRQSMASSALPLFLILREAGGEPAAGLDTHSCSGWQLRVNTSREGHGHDLCHLHPGRSVLLDAGEPF